MTRTAIRQNADRTVTMTCEHPITGERVVREFWAPRASTGIAYVREGDRQVCEFLGHAGSTLSIGRDEDLLPLIRREWRKARAAERRERARW